MREEKKYRGVYEKVKGSGVWWICYFDAEGRKKREKAGRKGVAIDLYRKRKTSVLEHQKLPEKFRVRAVQFSELAKDALEYSKAHKLSYGHDVYRMAKLTEEFGRRSADSITPQAFERWIADHEEWKPATANRYRALLSLMYRLGEQNRKVVQNPARLMRHRKENNARLRWLTSEEEKKLRTAIEGLGAQHISEFDLALHTGLRRSEQYRLTWDCVDLERQILTVPQSKNGEIRHVPLNSAAITALLLIKQHSSSTGRVFRATGPRQWFDPAVQNSGLTAFTWHCLRHTFASRLVMAGVDLRTVQELMGHKTIAMTCRYAHLAPPHKLAAVERLARAAQQESSSDTSTDTSNVGAASTDQASVQ